MYKEKYEISLWHDMPILEDENPTPLYFEEQKVAIIGSDSMTAPHRAFDPKLVRNINGTNTFTFKMYYTYTDNITGETGIINPFLSLLQNECKIKVKWQDEWYDFIIKSCQEDSNGKSITYTCEDIWINELSKTGFNLEYAEELANNSGTLEELATSVLAGSDWQLGETPHALQTNEEVTQMVQTLYSLNAEREPDGENESIESGASILLFYSYFQELISSLNTVTIADLPTSMSIYYAPNYITEDASMLVTNGNCYKITGTWQITTEVVSGQSQKKFNFKQGNNTIFSFFPTQPLSNYRAKRYIATYKSKYDPILERYVDLYTGPDDDVYCGFETVDYNNPTSIVNMLVNTHAFTSINGWISTTDKLTWTIKTITENGIKKSISLLSTIDGSATRLFNNGIRSNLSTWSDGLRKGSKLILRAKTYRLKSGSSTEVQLTTDDTDASDLIPQIFKMSGSTTGSPYSNYNWLYRATDSKIIDTSWRYYVINISKNASLQDLKTDTYKIKIDLPAGYFLGDIQLFKYVIGEYDGAKAYMTPDNFACFTIGQSVYKYYLEENTFTTKDDYIYIINEGGPSSDFTRIPTDSGYEKFKSISVKESNRFNILQTLAETFECYCSFQIQHDNLGNIVRDEDGIPKKKVYFTEEIGQHTGLGFIYGIDLKSIQRTVDSSALVTKTIVKANNNENGIDGFCTIQRSNQNYPKVNFILDFGYFESLGEIDHATMNQELYSSTGDWIGYYYNLNRLNKLYDSYSVDLAQVEKLASELDASAVIYNENYSSLESKISDAKITLSTLTGMQNKTWSQVETYILNKYDSDDILRPKYNQLVALQDSYESVGTLRQSVNTAISQNNIRRGTLKTQIQAIKDELDELNYTFDSKYRRFIQEGSWISDAYFDDNQYYLDAKSVAYTSSRPQITYNISVMRVSSLEEFRNKKFYLGDICFVQDPEFFGRDSTGTPYKEEVVITEIEYNFDQPQNDLFKVQNYRTQFEDLFSRITSTVQSLQYSQAGYKAAARAVDSNGVIKTESLNASIARNNDLVVSLQNDNVVVDSTGVTVTDLANANHKARLTSGGLFFTTDGINFKNALRGEGMSADFITTGTLNVDNIQILANDFPAFRWNKFGLNALTYDEGTGSGFEYSKFVRFDQYGLYAVDGIDTDLEYNIETRKEALGTDNYYEVLLTDANFAIARDGFFLRSAAGNGRVEISRDNAIEVHQLITTDDTTTDITKIKIGVIDEYDNYGIIFRNNRNEVTLEADAEGQLWLQNTLKIGGLDSAYSVILGKESVEVEDSNPVIFNANNKFLVYADGSITATAAQITGIVSATEGSIGGFNIAEDRLTTTALTQDNEPIITLNSGVIDNNPSIIVHGEATFTNANVTGKVNITEGTFGGFTITEDSIIHYINDEQESDFSLKTEVIQGKSRATLSVTNAILGENVTIGNEMTFIGATEGTYAKLLNPYNHDDVFIQTENNDRVGLIVKTDGTLSLGDSTVSQIILNANNCVIEGTNNGQSSFVLAPEWSTFNNVSVRGKITSAVFETGKISPVGGAMVFRPSFKLRYSSYIEDDSITFKLIDYADGLQKDAYLILLDNDGHILMNGTNTLIVQVTEIDSENDTFNIAYNNTILAIVQGAGSCIVIEDSSCIISINSYDIDSAIMAKKSLSMFDTSINDNSLVCSERLILGYLGDHTIGGEQLDGWGLYSDNVYLKGSLSAVYTVTQEGVPQNYFAGVSTRPEIIDEETKSPIVFWAGADGTTESDVKASKFIVTHDGTIYAKQGTFEGTIKSATIETAVIEGNGTNPSPNLTIIDGGTSTAGIYFKTRNGENLITSMSIRGEGIYSINDALMIDTKNNIVHCDSLKVNHNTFTDSDGDLELVDNLIGYSNSKIMFTKSVDTVDTIELDCMKTILKGSINQLMNTIIFGSDFTYKQIMKNGKEIGYDLYIEVNQ